MRSFIGIMLVSCLLISVSCDISVKERLKPKECFNWEYNCEDCDLDPETCLAHYTECNIKFPNAFDDPKEFQCKDKDIKPKDQGNKRFMITKKITNHEINMDSDN